MSVQLEQEKLLRYDASKFAPALFSRELIDKLELQDWSAPLSVRVEVRNDGLAELFFKNCDVIDA